MDTSLSLDNQSSSATSSLNLSSNSSAQSPPSQQAPPPLAVPPRRLPSSRYKGVVPQPNGRWGAQIYERHNRVWLGTFDSETSAAKAYDVAVQRFRGRDATTNFRPLNVSESSDLPQLNFLRSRSKSEVVDMLRKRTYNDELNAFTLSTSCNPSSTVISAAVVSVASVSAGKTNAQYYEHLFDKTVTPSDVGKLNRLVIPKQHAEKHFPLNLHANAIAAVGESPNKGMLLSFEDKGGKVWRFRYSYWNSSQSYVLTKGWSRFVKEKGLCAGDIVSFHRTVGPDKRFFIDWKLRQVNCFAAMGSKKSQVKGVLRLFGVDLVKVDDVQVAAQRATELHGVDDLGLELKRNRSLEGDSLVFKKQCVEA
ncbi:hypothetical protein LUZ60_008104 [Juncus effusus]|nr:hypothetical protein LUZ60_008104 [Juncus effusus]